MTSPSSSSSSQASLTSEYIRHDPTSMAYTSASTSFMPERPCRPFRIVMPPSSVTVQPKRKHEQLDEARKHPVGEMNQSRVLVREPLVTPSVASSFGPSGKLKAKTPKSYPNGEALLEDLAKSCLEDPEVDFSGSYLDADSTSSALSDKQRVQAVTHEIWRLTGYRFTVKDHPPAERGHKTRLWCSQDEARRSKHRGPGDVPRVSKQGELFAKTRYPCRSRLMISCIPDGAGAARVVTVRMHHYMRHESYFEGEASAAPPTSPPPPPPLFSSQFFNVLSAPLPSYLMRRGDRSPPPPPALREQEAEWEHAPPPPPEPGPSPSPSPPFASVSGPRPSPHFATAPSPRFVSRPLIDPQVKVQRPHPQQHPSAHPSYSRPPPQQRRPQPPASSHPPPLYRPPSHPPPPLAPPAPAPASQLPPAEIQARMRAHIARIRDFCDGLEYQLQYSDPRMLEALERDAAPFLALRDACLREEGR
ncbi:hypothetical protein B0H15DRAFT_851692 [Mycena belliarum]|uniref:Uncharacterized protein n=1 Tax=Mycena belliarum TaxID=1033014 RepID=A0AAD6TXC0_9AGAR|nr:hypothetical protein B0H15DRAFT_851692 [Mycena belliae]